MLKPKNCLLECCKQTYRCAFWDSQLALRTILRKNTDCKMQYFIKQKPNKSDQIQQSQLILKNLQIANYWFDFHILCLCRTARCYQMILFCSSAATYNMFVHLPAWCTKIDRIRFFVTIVYRGIKKILYLLREQPTFNTVSELSEAKSLQKNASERSPFPASFILSRPFHYQIL